ncbi:MAG: methyltransferase domain-containing protein [Parcubacteria group bacterium]|jgi:SAM-dependent methyltransferase
MINKNSNQIWKSISELGETLQKGYSVTDATAIRKQYLVQVKQYPLYLKWFVKIEEAVNKQDRQVSVLEYGSGPGLLAGKLVRNKNVKEYTAIEPEKIFRDMTRKESKDRAIVIDNTGEKYQKKNCYDVIIATATYHHLFDKPKTLKNFYDNLKDYGQLMIADAFIPEYKFDKNYNPLDKAQFIENVLRYASAQILAMPQAKEADIIDQIKAAFMDTLRVEELKVCISILMKQLKLAGFKEIRSELMKGGNKKINYTNLGYYFITAKK